MTSDMPKPDLESSIWIARPPEEIWNYIFDISNEAQWRFGVIDAQWTSEPPYGVGSTGLHIVENIGTLQWEIIEWEAPHNATWEFPSGRFKGIRGGYRVVSEDTGSRVTIHGRAKKWASLTKIIMLIMKRSLNRQNTADLEKLKAIMEA